MIENRNNPYGRRIKIQRTIIIVLKEALFLRDGMTTFIFKFKL